MSSHITKANELTFISIIQSPTRGGNSKSSNLNPMMSLIRRPRYLQIGVVSRRVNQDVLRNKMPNWFGHSLLAESGGEGVGGRNERQWSRVTHVSPQLSLFVWKYSICRQNRGKDDNECPSMAKTVKGHTRNKERPLTSNRPVINHSQTTRLVSQNRV